MSLHLAGQIARDTSLVLVFILLAGLFVAAEISLLSLRESALKQIEGRAGERLRLLVSNPNRFLAAAQVGVTFCGFLSAALGSERLGRYLIPHLRQWGMSQSWANAISLVSLTLVISYLSLVFGELVPKKLALYRTEPIAIISAPVIDIIATIFRPIIIVLSRSTDTVIKIFGISKDEKRPTITESELMDMVSGHASLSVEEREIVEEVFNASDLKIHEVMVPRTKVDFLDASLSIEKAMKEVLKHSHSRFPVVRGSSDEVIGFLHARDLLDPEKVKNGEGLIWEITRPILSLPGSKGVLQALSEMRSKRSHIAIVLDEYGGTDGIVTMEDLVETMIGEIRDEYDHEEESMPSKTASGDYEVDALISLEDLHDETGISLPEGPYETVGGFVMHRLGRIPTVNDKVSENGYEITVRSIVGKRPGELLISARSHKANP